MQWLLLRNEPSLMSEQCEGSWQKDYLTKSAPTVLSLCSKPLCNKAHVLVFPIALTAGFSILLLKLVMPQIALTFFSP